MVRDEELLGLLRDANFSLIFIGIESPRKSSLAETHKTQNEKLDLVAAVHKVQSYNMFISAGMIVGFANGDDMSRYVGTTGGTNFKPLNMTAEELRVGQMGLYKRLYAPEAFAARLLGNLRHFHNVRYRPEAFRLGLLCTFVRLARHYWRKGKSARRFFWGTIRKTLRHSPRSVRQVIMMLGMYKHFCEVHADAYGWDPWATPTPDSPAVQNALPEPPDSTRPEPAGPHFRAPAVSSRPLVSADSA